MNSQLITEKMILKALLNLEPERWVEVLDFIGYLRQRQKMEISKPVLRQMTARDLLQSGLVGLWADRTDIGDSAVFARQLRERAEQRGGNNAVG